MTVATPPPAALAVAVRRWKVGHHAFHVQLIVMNSLLAEVRRAVVRQDWAALSAGLERLACLYDAATASMRYASDFPREIYERFIRPSMSEPLLSPGFSGTLNREHDQMLGQLACVRATLRARQSAGDLPEEVHRAARLLWTSQARNRRHHVLICERFVPGRESQLMKFLRRNDD